MSEEKKHVKEKKVRGLLGFYFFLPECTHIKKDNSSPKSQIMFALRRTSTAAHLLTVAWFKGCSVVQINSVF